MLLPAETDKPVSSPAPIGRAEWIRGAAGALVLLWINAYICRRLFVNPTAYMNSMHGFWVGLAKHAGTSWWHAAWWPYWDCGIPFEFTYAPLVPGWIALWHAITGISHTLAFQSITGVVYSLGPVSLFVMAWILTRAPGCSFLAALVYSLTAPTQLIVPDERFVAAKFWDARRLYLMTQWDDTPHATALALWPLAILFLALSLQKRKWRYYIPTVVLIALMAAASEFGPVEAALAALCLLFVYRRQDWLRNLGITAAIGAAAYAIVIPFVSPAILLAIGRAGENGRDLGFSAGSFTALALVAVGWVVLWHYLRRWTSDWKLQFFALFAYLTSSVPVIAEYLHRQFLPQPGRYKAEMEVALALILAFGLRPLFRKAPAPLQVTLVLLILSLAGEQIVSDRRYANLVLQPRNSAETVEGRTSLWAEQNLPGLRVMLPGSIAMWADDFTNIPQFSGGSWSKAYNPEQQAALFAVYSGDAGTALEWLQAYGVGAVAVSGPKSPEYWKPYANPGKFDGVLPVLWRAEDVTIYKVPQRTASLAHVVPQQAVSGLEPYVRALDDPSLPQAEFRWEGPNRIHVSTMETAGQIISVQVSYHPGWHAQVGGRAVPIHRDPLGLMWFQPECNGACEVQLDYDGGWGLRIYRGISFAAMAGLVVVPLAQLRWARKANGGRRP